MKILSVLLLFVFLSISGCKSPEPDNSAMISSAKQIDERWVDAFNKADVDALMNLYWKSDELLVYPSNAVELRGWDEVREFYTGELSHMMNAQAKITDARYTAAGNLVFTSGRWTITVPTPEGPMFDINGRYTSVRSKQDGQWVITMEHASVPMLR